MPIVVDDEAGSRRHDLDQIEREAGLQLRRKLEAIGDRVVDADLDQPLRHGKRHQPLRRLPGDAELSGDLVLRVARDIIQPARARRVVEPRICCSCRMFIPFSPQPSRGNRRRARGTFARNEILRNCFVGGQLFDQIGESVTGFCGSQKGRLDRFGRMLGRQEQIPRFALQRQIPTGANPRMLCAERLRQNWQSIFGKECAQLG